MSGPHADGSLRELAGGAGLGEDAAGEGGFGRGGLHGCEDEGAGVEAVAPSAGSGQSLGSGASGTAAGRSLGCRGASGAAAAVSSSASSLGGRSGQVAVEASTSSSATAAVSSSSASSVVPIGAGAGSSSPMPTSTSTASSSVVPPPPDPGEEYEALVRSRPVRRQGVHEVCSSGRLQWCRLCRHACHDGGLQQWPSSCSFEVVRASFAGDASRIQLPHDVVFIRGAVFCLKCGACSTKRLFKLGGVPCAAPARLG